MNKMFLAPTGSAFRPTGGPVGAERKDKVAASERETLVM